MILQILGVIFLVVLLAIGLFVWRVYRQIKRHGGSDLAVAMSVLPSQSLELEPANRDDWQEQERLAHTEGELKKIGARHLGYFCTESGLASIRISLWDIKDQAVAALYEAQADIDGSHVSFIQEVACRIDAGSVCITSNPHASYDHRPKEHIIAFNESPSIIAFIKALKDELPAGKKPLKIDDARDFFISCYEDTAEWSWRKEQLASDRTQQTLAAVGVKVTDDLMAELIEIGENYAVQTNVNRARRLLAKQTTLSVEQWEKVRDRLVFINERMQSHHLLDALYELAGDLTENQEQVLEGFERNSDELVDPISAFQMLVSALDLKAKRVAKLDSPVKTECYLAL
ncbi:hypothetical protein [Gallaecimonas sp. GXIMD4217]|uniref:hypothetical protein n=1 Tax=Gallaecimonas sp. GXIMD4217 TaxID=3131927 RepID=UPI00311AF329